MTRKRDLKRIIRERQSKTGESYTTARIHVMRERTVLLGHDAAVLKVNQQSARVRIVRLRSAGHDVRL